LPDYPEGKKSCPRPEMFLYTRVFNNLTKMAKLLITLLTLVSFVIGGFFLSGNITGFAVADANNFESNIIGVMFIILGIVGFLLTIQKKGR
jgi:hypothetical protein